MECARYVGHILFCFFNAMSAVCRNTIPHNERNKIENTEKGGRSGVYLDVGCTVKKEQKKKEKKSLQDDPKLSLCLRQA